MSFFRSYRAVFSAMTMAAVLGLTGVAAAAVPSALTQQGRLFDAEGNPVTDTLTILFAVYDGPNDAAAVWTESADVTLEDGYFSVAVGESGGLEAVLDGSVKYLGITVGNDGEMTPRQAIGSVPYAFLANDAVGDIHPTSVSIGGLPVIDDQGQWVGDPTGLVGPTGPAGADGAMGPAGPQGAVGPEGPQGMTGAQGPQGPIGPPGAVGPTGPAGANGATGATGPAGPAGPAGPTSIAACPSGYTTIQLSKSTLCIYRDAFTSTWNSGTGWCYGLFGGASICTHEQMRRACSQGSFTLASGTWLRDRSGDDAALFVNGTDCNNFDGASAVGTGQPATYCCLEWMKY